ncbi:primary-amine oxidase [Curtobacterium sp. VKM Ac-1376]|uniref:primary-amine oxidase n=1 Tax=Curtobacterium sp. VKM Ac-1376 TaxID=123312 RepID=UPI00188ABC2C|nr:primary-amine oxidase [Curtobacterium sp. VKM Ac-1376]MBF4616004.1 primary-amine oxidase [Curtobacterium sp. VKM Ac-1376]
MTIDTPATPTVDTALTALHPLRPLAAAEIDAARSVLSDAGLVSASTRFSYVMLREPDKRDVLAFEAALANGTTPEPLVREVGALLTDLDTLRLTQVVVDLAAAAVSVRKELDSAVDGFGPTLDEDFVIADEIVKSDRVWIEAIGRRGVVDLDTVRTVPLSAGVFGYEDEVGRRVYRVLAFQQLYPTDSAWAHPIDGVVAHIDIDARRVLRVVETPIEHVPQESGDYLDPQVSGPERTTLKPIEITQPDGVSFTLKDGVLAWEGWKVRVGFNGREGLTLHQLSVTQGEETRPVMYRGSVSEMVVNYGDPTPTHAWQNYFDVGEYQFGRLANSLELGCDCLGEITYVDAVVVDDHGQPKTIPNAICIHEEDYGVLWKHRDDFAGTSETRRQRRLVVSFFVTVGNYDYGFYWYLYLDGTIQLEGKATGIVFTSGHDGENEYATPLAPGLGAPVHQHLFCARLDMTVDGTKNHVDEIDVARVPVSATNPWGNAITRTRTRLRTERQATRDADGGLGRVWSIESDERTNRVGEPTAFVLYPEGKPTLLTADDSSSRKRAGFAGHHLWVTKYDRDELWAAGYTVNQHPGGNGLPAYVAGDRSVDGEDIVLWHTFGLTHFPRLEDWPIMPVDYAGFTMKPHGFFDRNPTLDVPASLSSHGSCHADGHHDAQVQEPGGHGAPTAGHGDHQH